MLRNISRGSLIGGALLTSLHAPDAVAAAGQWTIVQHGAELVAQNEVQIGVEQTFFADHGALTSDAPQTVTLKKPALHINAPSLGGAGSAYDAMAYAFNPNVGATSDNPQPPTLNGPILKVTMSAADWACFAQTAQDAARMRPSNQPVTLTITGCS